MKIDLCPEEGAFYDLSSRAKFRVTGVDRERFLNGQVTNDARKANPTSALEACVLNAKGRTNAHLFFSSAPGAFFLDADPALREVLSARLERYVIADDVEINDITEEFAIFHALGFNVSAVPNEWRVLQCRRFLNPGWDLWVKAGESAAARKKLSSQLPFGTDEQFEMFRIESGIPRWGRELSEEIIPVEANLEERCIDYAKGCYIGQEVISRIKMSGQTNKSLCGLISRNGGPLSAEAKLRDADAAREVGWITSVGWSGRLNQQIALGFVKRGYNGPGSRLQLAPPESRLDARATSVEVVSLPFSPNV